MTELSDIVFTNDEKKEIEELSKSIDYRDPATIANFGNSIGDFTSNYADQVLEDTYSGELEGVGEKLSEIISFAKDCDPNSLRSRLGGTFIGKYVPALSASKEKLLSKFNTAKKQIDRLSLEVSCTRERIEEHMGSLNEMFDGVGKECRSIGMHIEAGNAKMAELREELKEVKSSGGSVQDISDLESCLTMLDKKVSDHASILYSSQLSLPTIRFMQSIASEQIEKYNTIRQLTIPTWKRQYLLFLAMDDQRKANELALSVDEATNQLLADNARLLNSNAVSAAKANQKPIIAIETLKEVQDSLITSVNEVVDIHRQGAEARKDMHLRITSLRKELDERRAITPTYDAIELKL